MRAAARRILLALALAAGGAAAAKPVDATQSSAPSAQDPLLAISQIDPGRLLEDEDYARQALVHIDRLETLGGGDSMARARLEGLRLIALATLRRRDEIGGIVDRLIARRPSRAVDYASAYHATLATEDLPRFVALVETASRQVPGVARGELNAMLPREMVGALLFQLKQGDQGELRARLAAALHRSGWPGRGDRLAADMVSAILVETALGRGDTDAAAGYAQTMSTSAYVLPMLVQRRYDPVLAPGADRVATLARLLEQEDQETLGGVQVAPGEPKWVLERVKHLRGVGRDDEALALLEPFLEDVAATAAAGEEGPWLVNEAVNALVALGRPREARTLMERLIALPLGEHPALISQYINHASMLLKMGETEAALAHATALEPEGEVYASEYGRMWIASTIACALARLERRAEAGQRLETMRAGRDANPSAMVLAYLCNGDEDAAAAEMVARLTSEDPSSAILALQDYQLSRGDGQLGPYVERLLALRERPEVRAALDRVGWQLSLPLSRSYWGNY